ncbi:MAG: tetratricopeptide repeat protein [Pseudomonadota bacterium]
MINSPTSSTYSRFFIALLGAFLFFSFVSATCTSQVSEKTLKQSQLHLELAQSYMKEGDLVSARREGILSVQKDPTNVEAHYTLSFVFVQLKDWTNAEKYVRLAIKHSKNYPEAENLLGTILIQTGDLDEAIEILTEVAEDFMYQTPHLALGNLGLAYSKKGEHEKALEALKRAVQLQPLFCLGYYRMGLVYSETERYKDALESLQKSIDIEYKFGDCKMLQEPYVLMGDIRMKLKTYDAAIESFRKCLEINQHNTVGIDCKRKINKCKKLLGEDEEEEEAEIKKEQMDEENE